MRRWQFQSIRCTTSTRERRESEAGYTLLEVLVVPGITVLLAAVVGRRLMQYFGKAKHDKSIETALELHYMDVGQYPPAELGLQALVATPNGFARWNGPYLQEQDGLHDPWLSCLVSMAITTSIRSAGTS